jgi:chromosome segregation ATPase
MTDDDKQMVTFKIDEETYEIAKGKQEHGELSEELRTKLNKIAYGTQTTKREKLREELESLRSDKRDIETQIDQLRDERENKERKIARIEDRLDALRDTEGEYSGALEMLESRLLEGERIYTKLDAVEKASQVGEKTKDAVIQDLQERNPDVPSCAFELSSPHEPMDWREVSDHH